MRKERNFPYKAYKTHDELKNLPALTPQEIETRKNWKKKERSYCGERRYYGVIKFVKENKSDFLDLRYANLERAYLKEAILTKSDLTGADLRGAAADCVDFTETVLCDADLCYADFSRAKNLHRAILKGVKYNDRTDFPPSFNPAEHGMIYEKITNNS